MSAERIERKPRASTAVVLGIVADLSGTIATFMPMKSVFILAADEIPSFFPQFLIDAGPAATGVLLIALAGVFGVISAISRKRVNTLAPANTPIKSSHFQQKKAPHRESKGLELGEATALSLVAVLIIASAVISGLFVLLVLGWTIGSLIVLSIQIHRSVRRPPYATGAAEFSARFSKWTTNSALWSTVAAAIVTLLISPPALGLTGILLAAVLLARFQQTVAKLAPLVYEGRARATHAEDPLLSTKPANAVAQPAEFFSTVAGRRTLNHVFEHLHLNPHTWSLIGQPTNTQLSLIAQGTADNAWKIVRIFSHGREDLMGKELLLRRSANRLIVPGTFDLTTETIWGLPTIVLSGQKIDQSMIFTPPNQQQLFDYQISWELDVLRAGDFPESIDSVELETLSQTIRSGLHVLANLPGQHQEDTTTLLTRIDPLLEKLEISPLVLTTGGAISGLNIVQHEPGSFVALDLSGWKLLPFGWAWPENRKFVERVSFLAQERQIRASAVTSGLIIAKLAALFRALERKDLRRVTELAKELSVSLRKF